MLKRVYFIAFSILAFLLFSSNNSGLIARTVEVTHHKIGTPASSNNTSIRFVQNSFSISCGLDVRDHFRPKNAMRTKAKYNTIIFDLAILPTPELKLLHEFKPEYFGYSAITLCNCLAVSTLRGPPTA